MRALLCCAVLAACGPKVNVKGNAFDEDLESRTAEAPPVEVAKPRPEAPPGKGLRSGTIERARLLAVLDNGPGQFLRQLEVTARMEGNRFIGWQLVQLLDRKGPLVDVDVVPGDVLLAVNGRTISRPSFRSGRKPSLHTLNRNLSRVPTHDKSTCYRRQWLHRNAPRFNACCRGSRGEGP